MSLSYHYAVKEEINQKNNFRYVLSPQGSAGNTRVLDTSEKRERGVTINSMSPKKWSRATGSEAGAV